MPGGMRPGRGSARQRERAVRRLELRADLDEDLEHRRRRGRDEAARERRGEDVAHRRAALELADDDVVAHVDEREVRDQADADAGRDEALDRGVVVGLEGDLRLEARRLAGALQDRAVRAACRSCRGSTTRRRGPSAAPAPCARRGWHAGRQRYIGSSSSGWRSIALSSMRSKRRLDRQRDLALAALQALQALVGLARRERHLDARDSARGSGRSRAGRSSRPPSGTTRAASARRARRRSRRARPRRRRAARG